MYIVSKRHLLVSLTYNHYRYERKKKKHWSISELYHVKLNTFGF